MWQKRLESHTLVLFRGSLEDSFAQAVCCVIAELHSGSVTLMVCVQCLSWKNHYARCWELCCVWSIIAVSHMRDSIWCCSHKCRKDTRGVWIHTSSIPRFLRHGWTPSAPSVLTHNLERLFPSFPWGGGGGRLSRLLITFLQSNNSISVAAE